MCVCVCVQVCPVLMLMFPNCRSRPPSPPQWNEQGPSSLTRSSSMKETSMIPGQVDTTLNTHYPEHTQLENSDPLSLCSPRRLHRPCRRTLLFQCRPDGLQEREDWGGSVQVQLWHDPRRLWGLPARGPGEQPRGWGQEPPWLTGRVQHHLATADTRYRVHRPGDGQTGTLRGAAHRVQWHAAVRGHVTRHWGSKDASALNRCFIPVTTGPVHAAPPRGG